MANDVVQRFYRIAKPSIHPHWLPSSFFLRSAIIHPPVIINYSSLSLPFHFSTPISSQSALGKLSVPLCRGLGPQQKSSTLPFMAAGAGAGEVARYGICRLLI